MIPVTVSSWADNWDKKTILTVNEAVQVPGAILQPGTYVMKLLDSLSDRHIVCIMNEKQNEVITTVLAIPNYRLKLTDKTQFLFWETPAGNPRALRAWFYPGDNFGQEFAYPKMKSIEFAKMTHIPVPTVVVETEAVDGAVRFTVADTGTGIPKEYQERIFEKFYQVPESGPKGTGLGLYIAKEIVRAHGGEIGVEGEPGKGSTFWFTLPSVAKTSSQGVLP
jgi:hypothetical protein